MAEPVEKVAPLLNQCEDCGDATDAEPCPGCKKLVCQARAEAEGEFCRRFPPADGSGGNGPPRPESAPDFDLISNPIIPGDRWNGTAGGPNAPEVSTAEGWRIRDLDELNRVLGRMARLERLREENREVVAKEVARKQEWLEKEDEALEKRYRDLEAHVYEFARDNRETLGKTRRLPNGVVSWRERKEGAYRLDPKMTEADRREKLLTWAIAYDSRLGTSFVEHRPAPNIEKIKKHMMAHYPRQDVPGLEWVGPGESLSIVVKEKP